MCLLEALVGYRRGHNGAQSTPTPPGSHNEQDRAPWAAGAWSKPFNHPPPLAKYQDSKGENPWDSLFTLEAPQLSARIARPQDYQQHPAQDTDTENEDFPEIP